MSFDSLPYLVFLPLTLLAHRLTPARFRWIPLLAASYVFYAWWHLSLSLLIFSVTALSWLAALAIDRTSSIPLRRACLWGTAVAVFGALGYFKYFNLLGEAVAAIGGLFGGTGQWTPLDILLPVGVSFYTFQAFSYVADVYRGRLPAERHFGYYALYISFFPQLVAGPIERAEALLPQLRAGEQASREDLRRGAALLLSGYFRKVAAADLVAPFVEAVFSAASPDGSAVAAGAVLFAVQIYCDFAGYSEIAMGSARLLGIRLMRNFDRPYGAPNLREFWRRWHISLSRWFTDYVYIPLGGSRHGLFRQLVASMTVFLLCGLWHGADWRFVVWGGLHGLGMWVYTLFRRFRGAPGEKNRLKTCLSTALTIAWVCLTWIFFRADSLPHAVSLLGRLFSPWAPAAGTALLMSAGRGASAWALLGLFLSILLVLRFLPAFTRKEPPALAWPMLLLCVLAACFIRMDAGAANAFIYFQF